MRCRAVSNPIQFMDPVITNFSGEHRTKPVPPKSNRLVADIDATLVQQILNISKRKWKPNIHHHRQADDFGGRLEVLEWVVFCHPERLGVPLTHFNQVSSDSASIGVPLQKVLIMKMFFRATKFAALISVVFASSALAIEKCGSAKRSTCVVDARFRYPPFI